MNCTRLWAGLQSVTGRVTKDSVLLVFNGTFSTNRLYPAIVV